MCPVCYHIMPNGARCQSPALHGTRYCYFHSRQRRIAQKNSDANATLRVPVIEDRSSLQIALNEFLCVLATGRLDPKIATLYLRGLQVTARNLAHAPSLAAKDAVQVVIAIGEDEIVAADEPEPAAQLPAPPQPAPAPLPDLGKHDAYDCSLLPERDQKYYLGMYDAMVTRVRLRHIMKTAAPAAAPASLLPEDFDQPALPWEPVAAALSNASVPLDPPLPLPQQEPVATARPEQQVLPDDEPDAHMWEVCERSETPRPPDPHDNELGLPGTSWHRHRNPAYVDYIPRRRKR